MGDRRRPPRTSTMAPCRNPWDPDRVCRRVVGRLGRRDRRGHGDGRRWAPTPAGSARIPAALVRASARCARRRDASATAARSRWRGHSTRSARWRAGPPTSRSVLAVIAGYDPEDPASSTSQSTTTSARSPRGVEGLRIGVLVGDWLRGRRCRPVAEAMREPRPQLEGLGAAVEEVELPGRAQAFDVTAELVLRRGRRVPPRAARADPRGIRPRRRHATAPRRRDHRPGLRPGSPAPARLAPARAPGARGRDLLLSPACGRTCAADRRQRPAGDDRAS